jgi:hypothetical protein
MANRPDINRLDTMSIDDQAQILEDAILNIVHGDNSVANNEIMNHYSQRVFHLEAPKLRKNDVPEIVYVHTLYQKILSNGTIRGPLRILDHSQQWRDADKSERPKYMKVIRELQDQNVIHFGDFQFVFRNGELHLRRIQFNGTALSKPYAPCSTTDVITLIDIMWDLRIPVPNFKAPSQNIMIDELSLEEDYDLLLTWDRERIKYYYYWYTSVGSRRELCALIYKHLQYLDDVKQAVDDY